MNGPVILSEGDLVSWREEIARIDAETRALATRRDLLSRRLEAAAEFMSLLREDPAGAPSGSGAGQPVEVADFGQINWVDIVRDGVGAYPMGVIMHEFKEEVADSPAGARLRVTDKGYYKAIDRLVRRGELIKHKGRLFSPAAHRRYMAAVARGEIEDVQAPNPGHSPLVEAARQMIEDEPGITSGRVVEQLRDHPLVGPTLAPKPTAVYNMISRLRDRRLVIKVGLRLYPATEEYAHLKDEDGATDAAPSLEFESETTPDSDKVNGVDTLHPNHAYPAGGGT